jgi:hypothetical protein
MPSPFFTADYFARIQSGCPSRPDPGAAKRIMAAMLILPPKQHSKIKIGRPSKKRRVKKSRA